MSTIRFPSILPIGCKVGDTIYCRFESNIDCVDVPTKVINENRDGTFDGEFDWNNLKRVPIYASGR